MCDVSCTACPCSWCPPFIVIPEANLVFLFSHLVLICPNPCIALCIVYINNHLNRHMGCLITDFFVLLLFPILLIMSTQVSTRHTIQRNNTMGPSTAIQDWELERVMVCNVYTDIGCCCHTRYHWHVAYRHWANLHIIKSGLNCLKRRQKVTRRCTISID